MCGVDLKELEGRLWIVREMSLRCESALERSGLCAAAVYSRGNGGIDVTKFARSRA